MTPLGYSAEELKNFKVLMSEYDKVKDGSVKEFLKKNLTKFTGRNVEGLVAKWYAIKNANMEAAKASKEKRKKKGVTPRTTSQMLFERKFIKAGDIFRLKTNLDVKLEVQADGSLLGISGDVKGVKDLSWTGFVIKATGIHASGTLNWIINGQPVVKMIKLYEKEVKRSNKTAPAPTVAHVQPVSHPTHHDFNSSEKHVKIPGDINSAIQHIVKGFKGKTMPRSIVELLINSGTNVKSHHFVELPDGEVIKVI